MAESKIVFSLIYLLYSTKSKLFTILAIVTSILDLIGLLDESQ